jgi:hypothetical protein
MGFEVVIEFIGLFDTAYDYTLHLTITHIHASVHNHDSTAVAWHRFSTADVSLPLGSQTVPGLNYQRLTATAHND